MGFSKWPNLPELHFNQYLGLFLVSFIVLTLPVFWQNRQFTPLVGEEKLDLMQIGPVPFLKKNPPPVLTKENLLARLSAKNILAIDIDSATVLLEKNATQSALPASTTKMMTAMVAEENLVSDQILTVAKEHLVNGNKIGFVIGEKVRVTDLLHALLIGSNNEAAEILASGFAGGKEEFVNLMNQKARQLNLEKTLFVNLTGLDSENIYSTARDLGILARELMKQDTLRQIVAQKEFTFFDVDQKFKHQVASTNQLLWENAEVVGVKTGTTDGAGEVLITQVEKIMACESANASMPCLRKILIVLMGSQDRYRETTAIINWIFDSYEWLDLDLNNLLE